MNRKVYYNYIESRFVEMGSKHYQYSPRLETLSNKSHTFRCGAPIFSVMGVIFLPLPNTHPSSGQAIYSTLQYMRRYGSLNRQWIDIVGDDWLPKWLCLETAVPKKMLENWS